MIDLVVWLKSTLSYFGVDNVDVQINHVDNGPELQCRISFSIAVRMGHGHGRGRGSGRGRGGVGGRNVLQISEVGIQTSQRGVAIKYAVYACVTTLSRNGITLPTLSSVKIQGLNHNRYHELKEFNEQMAQNSPMVSQRLIA